MNQLRSRYPCPAYPINAMDGMSMQMGGMAMAQMNMSMMDQQHHHHHAMMMEQPYQPHQVMNWGMANNTNCMAMPMPSPSMNMSRSSGGKKDSDAARIPYPPDFVPTIHHVICGRGKKSYGHCGNKNFLAIVAHHIDEYSLATTKQEKSDIVQSIVDGLEAKGGFVRLDAKTGLYFQAEEGAGREKTSQALRDCLNHKYKSSKDIKRKNRKEKRLAKQAVHEDVAEKRATDKKTKSKSTKTTEPKKTEDKAEEKKSVTPPPSPLIMDEVPSLPPLEPEADKVQSTSFLAVFNPPRSVSSTSVDMAAAAAAATVATKPMSPSPVLGLWRPKPVKKEESSHVHLIHELEPLPFRDDEVEKLPEEMSPFDFFGL